MCECLEYDDGFRLLCPVCADIADNNVAELAKALMVVEAARPFITLLPKIADALGGIMGLAFAHSVAYSGPNWKAELEQLTDAIHAYNKWRKEGV